MAELVLLPVASTLFVQSTFALNDGGKTEKTEPKRKKTHQSAFLEKSSPEKKGEAQTKCPSQLKI